MLPEEFVRIPVEAEKVLGRSKGFHIGMYEFIDYFAGAVLLFDFLVEVEEYVGVIREGSVEVELEPLG